MKGIKFRAWDNRNNEMVYSEKSDCFYINTKGVLFMYAIPKSESGLATIYYKSYDVEQFTGLKDINGKDIYEGDVISRDINCMYDVGKVNEEVGFWEGRYNSGDANINNVIASFNAKVIGNIHEDSELLL